jgi:hypothetical protein
MKHERRIKTTARQEVAAEDLQFLLDHFNRPGNAADVALVLAGASEAELPADATRARLWRLLRDPKVQARRDDLRECPCCHRVFFLDHGHQKFCSPDCKRKAHLPTKAALAKYRRENRQIPIVKRRAPEKPKGRKTPSQTK